MVGSLFLFIFGNISIFFGDKINYFTSSLTPSERFGVTLILLSVSVLSGYWVFTEKKNLELNFSFLFVSVCFFLAGLLVSQKIFFTSNPPYQNILIYFIPFLNLSVMIFFIKFFWESYKLIKKLNQEINDSVDKTTLLIAFFGIIISLLTYLN